MAPPPTPTSLMDLPAPWLLKLATSESLVQTWGELRLVDSLVPLFRTCAFFRDTVLQHRTTLAAFRAPITAERFPAELARLCAVARRSSNVKLTFKSEGWLRWEDTEPHITHLLVCAMAELGGPLTCVKEVHTKNTQQTALVPAWIKVCCPNVTSLEMEDFHLAWHPLALLPSPAPSGLCAPGQPPPLTCQRLQSISFGQVDDERLHQHIRQQLAALPSLTSLSTEHDEWLREPAQVSATVTSLTLGAWDEAQPSPHLAAQFPNLRELDCGELTLDDAGLEALLRLPHLELLSVWRFDVERSHAHRAWAVRHLSVWELDVDSFARLPLDGVQACTLQGDRRVVPSGDPQAVARVAAAVRRWGGLRAEGPDVSLLLDAEDAPALLTTLGPLLAALPAAQLRSVAIEENMDLASAATLRALGQQLPDGVTRLELCGTLQPEAWPVLLPSLPASVSQLWLSFQKGTTEEHLVAMCGAAVRRVVVVLTFAPGDVLNRARERLVEMGKQNLVTLMRWP